MNTYKKRNYRGKRGYSSRPHRRTSDSYHQPLPPDQNRVPRTRHTLTKPDVEAVVDALLSGTLSQGRELERFESLLSKLTHSDYAIAVSSGTAAIHAALACLKLEPQDEVIISTLSFCGIANMIKLAGAKPVLVDCDPNTLTLSPKEAEKAISPNTKAIFPNNFGGHPSDLSALRDLCDEHNLLLLEEAGHGLGGKYRGHYVGNQADITCFSFHASMAITTCEGGAVTTNNRTVAERIRLFRNHGIQSDPAYFQTDEDCPEYYHELQFVGMNYRLSELHAALGRSQLTRLDRHIERRRSIAQVYFQKLGAVEEMILPHTAEWADHAFHFFTVQFTDALASKRDQIYTELKAAGIDTHVHYIPIHRMPLYAGKLGGPDRFPIAETYYARTLSLPLFPDLSYKEIERICEVVIKLISRYLDKKETRDSRHEGDAQKADNPDRKKDTHEEKDASEPSGDRRSAKQDKASEDNTSSEKESDGESDKNKEKSKARGKSTDKKKPGGQRGSRSSRLRKVPKSDDQASDDQKKDVSNSQDKDETSKDPDKPAKKTRRKSTPKQTSKSSDKPKTTRKPRKTSTRSGKKSGEEQKPGD